MERAMSEIEFERIMDAVQKAVMLVPVQEALEKGF